VLARNSMVWVSGAEKIVGYFLTTLSVRIFCRRAFAGAAVVALPSSVGVTKNDSSRERSSSILQKMTFSSSQNAWGFCMPSVPAM
jgi:hypothetical protein